jgi:glycosyltransferase involved in cell wall biosynthesis
VSIWPKITLVTVVFNSEKYLNATMRSIVSQGYPNLEYVVVDGGSTDGTVEIIRKYEKHLAWWISEPDKGMYDALNKGFARSSGEIMGWLNAGDMLHPNALFVVGGVFAAFPEVEWITGRPTTFTPDGMTINVGGTPRWTRYRFLAGANEHIQQESTFWRRSLWERAGGYLDTSYRAEGDFELWVRFFRHACVYPVDALIGGYRIHEDALSWGNIDKYRATCEAIVDRELDAVHWGRALKLFRLTSRAFLRVPKIRQWWHRFVIRTLYERKGPDSCPVIGYQKDRWQMCSR